MTGHYARLMFDTRTLATALAGLVGFRPDPAGKVTLPPGLLASRSGLYVQDASELLVLDVLRHVVPRGEELPAWLLHLQSDALIRFVESLVKDQQLSGKVLLADTPVVKTAGNRASTVNKLGRFVGVQLAPTARRGVAFAVPSLSIQLDGVLDEPLTLYLYSESQPDPIAEWQVPVGNRANFPYSFAPGVATLPAGKLWLGYYEADLPLGVRAIEAPVGSCGCTDDPYLRVAEHMAVEKSATTLRGFSVPAAALDSDRLLFDPAAVALEPNNFGLNPTLTSYCDIATALQSPGNQQRLAPLVQQAYAVRLLEALVSAPNVTQVTSRPDIQADAMSALLNTQAKLYGGKVAGTDIVYPSALKNVALDLSGLDPVCGPPAKPSLLSIGRLVR